MSEVMPYLARAFGKAMSVAIMSSLPPLFVAHSMALDRRGCVNAVFRANQSNSYCCH